MLTILIHRNQQRPQVRPCSARGSRPRRFADYIIPQARTAPPAIFPFLQLSKTRQILAGPNARPLMPGTVEPHFVTMSTSVHAAVGTVNTS